MTWPTGGSRRERSRVPSVLCVMSPPCFHVRFLRLLETGDFMTSVLRKVTEACIWKSTWSLKEKACVKKKIVYVYVYIYFIPIQSYIF